MFKKIIQMFSGNINEELIAFLSKNAFLVDVRTPAEFSEGHVEGSVNIPLDQLEYQLDAFKNHSHIVVFCRSGNRSGQAKSILEKKGITSVVNGGALQYVNEALKQINR